MEKIHGFENNTWQLSIRHRRQRPCYQATRRSAGPIHRCSPNQCSWRAPRHWPPILQPPTFKICMVKIAFCLGGPSIQYDNLLIVIVLFASPPLTEAAIRSATSRAGRGAIRSARTRAAGWSASCPVREFDKSLYPDGLSHDYSGPS